MALSLAWRELPFRARPVDKYAPISAAERLLLLLLLLLLLVLLLVGALLSPGAGLSAGTDASVGATFAISYASDKGAVLRWLST
jgi:hypothetical protein